MHIYIYSFESRVNSNGFLILTQGVCTANGKVNGIFLYMDYVYAVSLPISPPQRGEALKISISGFIDRDGINAKKLSCAI